MPDQSAESFSPATESVLDGLFDFAEKGEILGVVSMPSRPSSSQILAAVQDRLFGTAAEAAASQSVLDQAPSVGQDPDLDASIIEDTQLAASYYDFVLYVKMQEQAQELAATTEPDQSPRMSIAQGLKFMGFDSPAAFENILRPDPTMRISPAKPMVK